MKVKKADPTPNLESMLKVRGSDDNQQTSMTTTPKTTGRQVVASGVVTVSRYLTPTRTWSAYKQ